MGLALKSHEFRQEGNDFVVRSRFGTRRATMPEGWSLKAVHPSVLKVVEWILLCNIPAYHGHFVPYEELLQLQPREPQGHTNLLAYSGGADSTAASLLLRGSDYLPVYLRRRYREYQVIPRELKISLSRRLPFFRLRDTPRAHVLCAEGYVDEVVHEHGALVIDNDLELLSTDAGEPHGFRYGYGYGAIIALLADFYGANAVSFGSVLETVWMGGGGMNPVQDAENAFVDITSDPDGSYNIARNVFAIAGLGFCQPVGGCSEAITNRIAEEVVHVSCPNGYDTGTACMSCFKCFRKEQLQGRRMEEPLHPRVTTALSATHLTMAASVIEGCHGVGHFPQEVARYQDVDTSWTRRHYDASLDLLCDSEVAEHVRVRLAEFGVEKMDEDDYASMVAFLR